MLQKVTLEAGIWKARFLIELVVKGLGFNINPDQSVVVLIFQVID